MTEITIEQIRMLQQKHGMKLVSKAWGRVAEGTACPVTLLCLEQGVDMRGAHVDCESMAAYAARVLDVPESRVSGFVDGFDGCEDCGLFSRDQQEYAAGYLEGVRLREGMTR